MSFRKSKINNRPSRRSLPCDSRPIASLGDPLAARPFRLITLSPVHLVTLLLALALLTPCAASGSDWLSDVTSVFEQEVDGLMREYHVPGVSIAVVQQDAVVWSRQYGVTNVDRHDPVNTRTLFEACSMSKPLFAYGVLQMVERGKLDLDKPLVDYLQKPYMEDDDRHKRITARMVLCHTTGLPNWRQGQLKNPIPPKLKYDPGTRFTYSGEGYTFLQTVVERITGQSMDQFMRDHVLDPLGMQLSTYCWNENAAANAAAGHYLDGTLKTNNRRFTRPNAAYTLFTTPEEYSLYLIEMMRKDRSATHSLSAEMLKSMLTRQTRGKSEGRWYGLGWAILETDDADQFYHGGSNGTGFRCFCWFDPVQSHGIVIMTNSIGGAKLHEQLLKSAGVLN